jgi:iron complex transport system substrate-binding protein
MIRKLLPLLLLIGWACKSPEVKNTEQPSQKIITAGGTITEMVYELGFGDQIIATDITSTYPASMQSLPSIGYRNQIKAEGILALAPDLVLVEEGYLTQEVIDQLGSAQVKVQFFKKPVTVQGTKDLISQLAGFFGVQEKGQTLLDNLNTDLQQLDAYLATTTASPKATFIMARGPQTVFMAGEETFAQEMFRMAGLQPAGQGFNDFVPVTPESLVSMNPDFLVFFNSGLESLGGKEALAQVNGLGNTTAVQKGQVISLDGQYLSGFGPRVGKAALELAKAARP